MHKINCLFVAGLIFACCCFATSVFSQNITTSNKYLVNTLTISKALKPKKSKVFKNDAILKIRVLPPADSMDVLSNDLTYTGRVVGCTEDKFAIKLIDESNITTYKNFTERFYSRTYPDDSILNPIDKQVIKEISFASIETIGKERRANQFFSTLGIYTFIAGLVVAPVAATNFKTFTMDAQTYYKWAGSMLSVSAMSFAVSFTLGVKKYHIGDSPEIKPRKRWIIKKT